VKRKTVDDTRPSNGTKRKRDVEELDDVDAEAEVSFVSSKITYSVVFLVSFSGIELS